MGPFNIKHLFFFDGISQSQWMYRTTVQNKHGILAWESAIIPQVPAIVLQVQWEWLMLTISSAVHLIVQSIPTKHFSRSICLRLFVQTFTSADSYHSFSRFHQQRQRCESIPGRQTYSNTFVCDSRELLVKARSQCLIQRNHYRQTKRIRVWLS